MTTALTATQAKTKLSRIMEETAKTHKPILIIGKRTDAILISQKDWIAVQQALHLPTDVDSL